MAESLTFEQLSAAVGGQAAALRSITRLQPVGGEGDKIFPATYSGGVYATERRVLPGEKEPVDCVLIDSVQSQANRAEEALKAAVESGEIQLPLITVDFSGVNSELLVSVPQLTSLDVPHRLADAILRDSQLADGTRFSRSTYAERWRRSTIWDAIAVYELCPTALVFGLWGSPENPGGLGAKFERAYVSEIVAVDVQEVELRHGVRIDPTNASAGIRVKQTEDGGFAITATGGVPPSKINHSSVPFTSPNGGIRCRFVEQTTVVSLGALRKLRFPVEGSETAERNQAARVVLAALALAAGVLASERGTSLRSRCQLWPTAARVWEVLENPGKDPLQCTVEGKAAMGLLKQAVEAAAKAGVVWDTRPIVLNPTPEYVALIRKSQERQSKGKDDDGSETAAQAAGAKG